MQLILLLVKPTVLMKLVNEKLLHLVLLPWLLLEGVITAAKSRLVISLLKATLGNCLPSVASGRIRTSPALHCSVAMKQKEDTIDISNNRMKQR